MDVLWKVVHVDGISADGEYQKMQQEEFNSVMFEEYDEQFMYFLGVALALLVLEMLIGERRSRRHLFER